MPGTHQHREDQPRSGTVRESRGYDRRPRHQFIWSSGSGVYQVDDGTGQMWVFSQNFGVPSNGAKIAVTGNRRTGLQFWRQKLRDHPQANEASILNRKNPG